MLWRQAEPPGPFRRALEDSVPVEDRAHSSVESQFTPVPNVAGGNSHLWRFPLKAGGWFRGGGGGGDCFPAARG